jgi:hypothetical protein
MNYIEESQQELRKALEQVKLDPYEFGKYILEKISEDRNVHALKNPIVIENDQHKIEYNDHKAFLLQMEYIALQLTKNKYDVEQESGQNDH